MEEHMIQAILRMLITPPKRNEALRILKSVAELCRDSPGCLACHVHEDLEEKNLLMFEQLWRSQEDLELHLRSEDYHNLLLVLDMAARQPEIRFDTISSSAGIETIEKARSQPRRMEGLRPLP
jgi:quinol monooxygenase YgiN